MSYSDKNKISGGNSYKTGQYSPGTSSVGVNITKRKKIQIQKDSSLLTEQAIGLNDLDTNIIKKNLIKFIPTDALRLELMIERSEQKLNLINEEIKANKILNLNNDKKHVELMKNKLRLEKEISSYRENYRELGISYKVIDKFNQSSLLVKDKIASIKNKILDNKHIKKITNVISKQNQKQKTTEAVLLNKKLRQNMNNKNPNSKEIELLLIKSEKFQIK